MNIKNIVSCSIIGSLISITGCSEPDKKTVIVNLNHNENNMEIVESVKVNIYTIFTEIKYKKHHYIICRNQDSTGLTIIHAEHCPCKDF